MFLNLTSFWQRGPEESDTATVLFEDLQSYVPQKLLHSWGREVLVTGPVFCVCTDEAAGRVQRQHRLGEEAGAQAEGGGGEFPRLC